MKLAVAANVILTALASLKLGKPTEAAPASGLASHAKREAVKREDGKREAGKAASSAARPLKDIKAAIKARQTANFSAREETAQVSIKQSKQPDVSFLTLRETRELQAGTCAEFVQCLNGSEVDDNGNPTGSTCQEACGGQCCKTDTSCFYASLGLGFTGKVCKDGVSCDGNRSCADGAHINEVISSCVGPLACAAANAGTLVDSCKGLNACNSLALQSSKLQQITRSCNNEAACFVASYYGLITSLTDSCNGPTSCDSMALYQQLGEVKDSCNGSLSCASLDVVAQSAPDLFGCCNDDGECFSTTAPASLPPECAVDSSGPGADTLTGLESNAAALGLNQCVVNDVSESSVLLECTFDSTDGVSAKAQILEASCSDNNDFNTEASSAVTTGATITASLDFGSSITAAEKNAASFTKSFCARADVLADNNGTPVSIGVEKVNIVVTMSFSNTGNFEVTGINVTPVTIEDSTASATRLAQISAALGACGGTSKASYNVGERVEICVSSEDSNAEITAIKSVSVTNPSTMLVGNDGVANALSSIGDLPSTAVTFGTLIIAAYDDSGVGSITISGTADISYVGRRLLEESREVQEESSSETFNLEVPLAGAEDPDIVDDIGNSAMMGSCGISFLMAMGVLGLF